VPASFCPVPLRDAFTGASIAATKTDSGAVLDAATVFAEFPIALLVSEARQTSVRS
jgi:hypothetical protein